jgi:hypothetical protein
MFKKPLFYFDPDAAGGPLPPAEGDQSKESTPDAGGNGGTNQADLDRQFADRAKRAAETERKKIFEALGVDSQEAFDALIKAKKDAEEAQKTEIQRLTEATKSAQKALNTAQKRILDSEIKLLATQPVEKDGKVTRTAFRPDALDIVIALIDRNGIKDEEGQLTGIAEALDALAKEKPFLLVGDGKSPAPKGTPGPAAPKPNNQTQTTPATPQVVVGTTL